jgi:hypothetical protein
MQSKKENVWVSSLKWLKQDIVLLQCGEGPPSSTSPFFLFYRCERDQIQLILKLPLSLDVNSLRLQGEVFPISYHLLGLHLLLVADQISHTTKKTTIGSSSSC